MTEPAALAGVAALGVIEATPAQDVPSAGAVNVVVVPAPDCDSVTCEVEPSEVRVTAFVVLPFTRTGPNELTGVGDAPDGSGVGVAVADEVGVGVDVVVVVGVAVGVAVATVVGVVLELLQALSPIANATRASHGLKFFMHPHNGSGVTYGNRPPTIDDRTSHKAKKGAVQVFSVFLDSP